MYRLIILLLAGILATVPGHSQWTCLNPRPTCENLGTSFFVNDNYGFILGNGGTFLKTNDAGETWQFLDPGVTVPLYSVFFTDTVSGVAVGDLGTIVKTADGGTTWTDVSTYDPTLLSVFFPSHDTGYTVGLGGTILKTVNSGYSWIHCPDASEDLHDVWFTSNNTGYAVGDSGLVIKTTDGGQTWTELNTGMSDTDFGFCVTFPDPDTGYICYANWIYWLWTSYVLKTTDGGVTWTEVLNASWYSPSSIFFPDASTGYVAGDFSSSSKYLKTTDGGTTWTEHEILPPWIEASVDISAFIDPDHGYATGKNGRIYHTTDGGSTWTPRCSGYWADVLDLDFADEMTGFFNDYHVVYRTRDGGLTWDSVFPGSIPPGTGPLHSICFPSPSTGYLTQYGNIWKTSDTGNTWTPLVPPYPYTNLKALSFASESVGYVCTTTSYIAKTTDGGTTWELQELPYNLHPGGIFCLNETTAWATCEDDYYVQTTDGGANWIMHNTGWNRQWSGVFFLDEDNGFLFGYGNGTQGDRVLLKTKNGGYVWQNITAPAMGPVDDARFFDPEHHGYAVSGNTIWYTPDGGDSWTAEKETTGILYTSVDIATNVFVGGSAGALWTHPCPWITPVDPDREFHHKIPCSVSPNPATDHTVIGYQLEEKGTVELSVTDGTGRLIRQSRYHPQEPGTYEIQISLRTLPAGLYTFTLRTAHAAGFGKIAVLK